MYVCLFRKKKKETLLLLEQRNDGTIIQDILLPFRKILPNRRKMSTQWWSPRTEETEGFTPVICDPLLKMVMNDYPRNFERESRTFSVVNERQGRRFNGYGVRV